MANLQAFERSEYQQVKADLHRKILDRLDLEKLGRTPSAAAREEVLQVIRSTVNSEAVPLSFAERERLSRDILDEIYGLGALEQLLKDPTISDILVNRFNKVYVERAGKLEITGLSFKDDQHLMQIIDRIVSRVGRRVDESSPMVDARLADGSRVNAIIPPLALDGPVLSIRRFGREPITARNMIENRTLTDAILKAMNIGHEGYLSTVDANSPRDALHRLESMFSMANLNIPERAIRQQIASAIHVVVQIARLPDGTRKVISVSEITGMEDDSIWMQDVFTFDRLGMDPDGKVRGVFRATGAKSKFADRLASAGYGLRAELFESRTEV